MTLEQLLIKINKLEESHRNQDLRLMNLEGTVVELRHKNSDLEALVHSLEMDIDEFQQEKLNRTMSESISQNPLEARMQAFSNKIELGINLLEERLCRLEKNVAEPKSNLEALDSKINVLQLDVIQPQIDVLKEDVRRLTKNVDAQAEMLGNHQEHISLLKLDSRHIDRHEENIAGLEAQIEDIDRQLFKINVQIKSSPNKSLSPVKSHLSELDLNDASQQDLNLDIIKKQYAMIINMMIRIEKKVDALGGGSYD